jgi:hypothetical protein
MVVTRMFNHLDFNRRDLEWKPLALGILRVVAKGIVSEESHDATMRVL